MRRKRQRVVDCSSSPLIPGLPDDVATLCLDCSSSPLIPGLPDEVATLCLLRVPAGALPSCRRVCKRWNSILGSNKRISTLRKKLGFRDPWLVVSSFENFSHFIQIKVLNLATLLWHTLNCIPDLYLGQGYFRSASIPREGVVFFFGGVVCFNSTANVFVKYEVRENRWTIIKAMTGRLGKFSAGVIDGKVYLTDLHDKKLSDREHDPIEVLDPEKGTWERVPRHDRTTTHIDFDSATVFNGKLHLMHYKDFGMGGGYNELMPMSQIYDPRSGKWESMSPQLRQGLSRGFGGVEVDGQLFVLARDEKSGLRVYDAERDCWDIVEGNDLPEPFLWAEKFCSWDTKIYVVFNRVVIAGTISRVIDTAGRRRRSYSKSNTNKCRFRVHWEIVVGVPVIKFSNTHILSAQGTKPRFLKNFYGLLVHLSSCGECGVKFSLDSHDFELQICHDELKIAFREICKISDILFKELGERFKQFFAAFGDKDDTKNSSHLALLSNVELIHLLLRCCLLLLPLFTSRKNLMLEKGQVLLKILGRLSSPNSVDKKPQKAFVFQKSVFRGSSLGDNSCSASSFEDFTASLQFLDP